MVCQKGENDAAYFALLDSLHRGCFKIPETDGLGQGVRQLGLLGVPAAFQELTEFLGEIVRGVSYENARRYFHFAEKK